MTSETPLRVAIAGATGQVGQSILAALLESTTPLQSITLLSRHPAPPDPQGRHHTTAVDYADVPALTSAIANHDILISTIGSRHASATNEALLTAALAARVPRFFPSEYSLDVSHPRVAATAAASYGPKLAFLDRLAREAAAGRISWTIVMPSQFLDDEVGMPWMGFDLRSSKVTLYDGGRERVTGCTVAFTGRAVARAVRMRGEEVHNRRIAVAEVSYSGKEVQGLFEEAMGRKFETVVDLTSEDTMRIAAALFAEGKVQEAYLIDVRRLNYDGAGAANFEGGLTWGLEELPRKSLKSIIEGETRRWLC